MEQNKYERLSPEELKKEKEVLSASYESFKAKKLSLNMTRGVPCKEQLALSDALLTLNPCGAGYSAEGIADLRNYGGLPGTAEARELFRRLLELDSTEEVAVFGNSSLNIMYDTVMRAYCFGVGGGGKPWKDCGKIKFLCPVPGYDRHFSICEAFGIEMVNVKMTPEGPDMDEVERLVRDPLVKGIWNTPKYSNPTGITYSDSTVRRFAAMKPAAGDFRIFWDNAYPVHRLTDEDDVLLNLMAELKKNNAEDMLYIFASTSKITFPGGGITAFASSKRNVDHMQKCIFFQTICPDKINQARHTAFLKDADGIKAHMDKHRKILAPKFKAVEDGLKAGLAGVAEWTTPRGGYFVSLDTPAGCAAETVRLAAEIGIALTPAGSTFPYKKDPEDKNIRIAPTMPSVSDLETAVAALSVCVRLAVVSKLLSRG